MSIPLVAAQAAGGSILTLDDPTVVKDVCATAGTGGSVYTPSFLSSPFDAGAYGRLRRWLQHVRHEGTATVAMTPYREGGPTGNVITRTLGLTTSPHVTFPAAEDGSEFQVGFAVTAFSAPVELGAGAMTVIGRRSVR